MENACGRSIPHPLSSRLLLCVCQSIMQLVFLGYGVGKFELEFVRGSPQLSDITARVDSQRSAQQKARASLFTEVGDVVEDAETDEQKPAAARFDLSFIPPPTLPQAQGASGGRGSSAPMRSSWATDQSATSSMDPIVLERAADRRKERERQRNHVPWYEQSLGDDQASPIGQMGDPEADAQAAIREARKPKAKPGSSFDPAAALAEVPAPTPTPTAAPAHTNIIASVLPQEMHLIVHSSVIVYQNCMVSKRAMPRASSPRASF